MASIIPLLLFAVPCVLGAWLWWSVRGNGGKRTSYKSRRVPVSSKRAAKIQGETTHKDYADKTTQAAANTSATGADRVERSSDSVAAIVQHPMLRPVVGDVATVRFEKGAHYLLADGRVMECVGFRGNKERRAAFMDYGELEYWPQKRTEHADYFLWNVIRLDNGVEVCDRGRIRADHLASEQQAAEWAKMVKEREDGQRAYWAERKAKRERDAKRLAELEKLAKEKGWE